MMFLKFLRIVLAASLITSCANRSTSKPEASETDSLVLKVAFFPAFEENSETTLWSFDSVQGIKILIKNNVRVDEKEDTFYFKSISLPKQLYLHIDSTLIKMCRQKVAHKTYLGLDGMSIQTLLASKGDTNSIYFWNPSKRSDSTGYIFTKSLFRILGDTFSDTLINEYLIDLNQYIDESKTGSKDPARKIDQLRMKKYNWTIEKAS